MTAGDREISTLSAVIDRHSGSIEFSAACCPPNHWPRTKMHHCLEGVSFRFDLVAAALSGLAATPLLAQEDGEYLFKTYWRNLS
jgi:hypothetical protein